jgi:hypothetical protein
LVRRHGPGNAVALHQLTAHLQQCGAVGYKFDASAITLRLNFYLLLYQTKDVPVPKRTL